MQIILQVPIVFEDVEVGGADGIVIDVASGWVVLVVFIFQK